MDSTNLIILVEIQFTFHSIRTTSNPVLCARFDDDLIQPLGASAREHHRALVDPHDVRSHQIIATPEILPETISLITLCVRLVMWQYSLTFTAL